MIEYVIDNCVEVGKIEVYPLDKKDKALSVFSSYQLLNPFKKAVIYVDGDEDKRNFIEELTMLQQSNPYIPMSWSWKQIDNRKKIPRTKVLLHYFAGTVNENKNILYMAYDTVNLYNPASDMAGFIRDAV